jgi:hypothetical protein
MKNIPKFKNETEESEFWLKNDSTEYIDWQKAKSVSFENLKHEEELMANWDLAINGEPPYKIDPLK